MDDPQSQNRSTMNSYNGWHTLQIYIYRQEMFLHFGQIKPEKHNFNLDDNFLTYVLYAAVVRCDSYASMKLTLPEASIYSRFIVTAYFIK